MAKVLTGADVKGQFKRLSEADVRAYSGDVSFRKGYDSYLQHAIVEPTLSGSVLRAACHDSSGNTYEALLLVYCDTLTALVPGRIRKNL